MESKLLDQIGQTFRKDLPSADALDGYLDAILPKARPWSEDLSEKKYLGKPWLEKRDEDDFHQVVLHFFNNDDEYIKSVNGDIAVGKWRFLEKTNKLIIFPDGDDDGELYDLAFQDNEFFVLAKHGDQKKLGHRKYFFMVIESRGKKLEWREAVELLFKKTQSNVSFYILILIIIVLLLAIFLVLR